MELQGLDGPFPRRLAVLARSVELKRELGPLPAANRISFVPDA
jgi:hypothetical protein